MKREERRGSSEENRIFRGAVRSKSSVLETGWPGFAISDLSGIRSLGALNSKMQSPENYPGRISEKEHIYASRGMIREALARMSRG